MTKRYTPQDAKPFDDIDGVPGMIECPNGEFVHYSDYEELLSLLKTLREAAKDDGIASWSSWWDEVEGTIERAEKI